MDLREAVDSRHAAIGSEVQTLPSESFGPIDPERGMVSSISRIGPGSWTG
jgi:hypothetical protein